MRKNKKLLTALALNTLAVGVGGVQAQSSQMKYENVYNKITKNLEKNKSNDENYKLLEKILNKRNKELKDLYLQGDYIVKPEYLEWQVFFTGFYNHSNRGGNREERIPIAENEGKKIDLGVFIPVKGKTVNGVNLDILSPDEPEVNVNLPSISAPQISDPIINFTPVEVPGAISATTDFSNFYSFFAFTQIGENTNNIQYNSSGNTIYENLNVTSSGEVKVQSNSDGSIQITGETSYNNGVVSGTTPASYTFGSSLVNEFSLMTMGIDGDFSVGGDWKLNNDYNITDYVRWNPGYGFLSYRPYYITSDSKVEFNGNLEMTGNNIKTGLYLDLQNQASLPDVTATLENKGTITVTYGSGMTLNAKTKDGTVSGELINSGIINLNRNGIGLNILYGTSESGKAIVKPGIINVNGDRATGIHIGLNYIGPNPNEATSNIILDGSDGLITVNSDMGTGIVISRNMGIAGGINPLENIKNLNIIVNSQRGSGIVLEAMEKGKDYHYILTDKVVESIKFGPDSKSSSLFTVSEAANSEKVTLELDESLKNAVGIIDTGTMNTVVTTEYHSKVINNMPIEITENAKAMYALTTSWYTPTNFTPSPIIINNADVINNSSPYTNLGTTYGALGMGALSLGATLINNGNLDMGGENAIGIYNRGTAESKSDHIIINNNKGTVIYGGYAISGGSYNVYTPSVSKISANRLEVNGDNGAVIYSKPGDIELSPLTSGGSLEITANGKSTYAFYHETVNSKDGVLSGKFKINDTVNVNLKNGAIGFYYDGNYGNADIQNYFTNVVDISNGQLNVIADESSYNMAIGHATVKISDLSNLNIPNVNFVNGVDKIKIFQGTVNIDIDSDIDKNNSNGNKTFRNLGIGQSSINLENGVKITGTENSLIGIGQSSKYYENTSYINNDGTIDLKGDSSVGIYNKRGRTNNAGTIDVRGNKSIGLYEISGYLSNTGEIRIADNGIGIYNTTYLDTDDNPYDYSYSSIENAGKIISDGGNKSIGIYANNNTSYGYMYATLYDTSNIDMSASKGGIGIYANKSGVYSDWWSGSAGEITVGENGVGLYAKDSDINITNLELNLNGDNAVGIYLDGTTNFTGTGNINVDGKGITVFNVLNTGGFDQSFNISSTAGSSYNFQNLIGKTSYYNSTASLGQGGTFISGTNSAVLLDSNSQLVSTDSNVVALALDGVYSGLTNINGIAVNDEATNKGIISFGDDSVGIFVKNGASALNEGTISLGSYSVGLYGSGAGTEIANTGNISIGSNSAGLYLKDGNKMSNSGNVSGSGDKTVGLYFSGADVSEVNNTGSIMLSGNGSVGIYMNGVQADVVNNAGNITTGDSGVGIFNKNANAAITNAADITGGAKAVGLYTDGGTINHLSGDINTGSEGVNVYAVSGTVTLNNGILNADDVEEVGIYGKDGANIDNNMEMKIAQNNYGIILDTGSNLINRNKSTLGESSVLLYSNNGSSVFNDTGADITMNGSNSMAFYMENGGDLVNKADITGGSGTANIGIYTKGVNVDNSGNIKVGDSMIIDAKDPAKNFYSVGIYNEKAENFNNTGNIEIGADSIGVYLQGNTNSGSNSGNIVSNANGAIGIYTVTGTLENSGNITLSGEKSIGIAAALGSKISNSGTITMNGNESTGIYASLNSTIVNEKNGAIYINGNNSTGVQLSGGSKLVNNGKIEIASGIINSLQVREGEGLYEIPSIINAGVIKVDEKFDLNGLNLIIRADVNSFRVPTIDEVTINDYNMEDMNAGFLLTNSVQIAAPSFDYGTEAVNIDPLFTQGTNARVYKFENVFDPMTEGGGLNSGELTVKSGSLTFDAIPNINSNGKVDIWMEKIDYDQFTKGLWYDSFAKNIEGKYLDAVGDALKVYDKLDLINDINDFDSSMEQLAGKMYANINQREQNIYGVSMKKWTQKS
ncbi:autotransporter domain-containing protein [Sebaldella sp. S0638]|uniref:autotransporter domain-containing protein n=1 Tax=Sebaldella sp. S0638 TaxID=2957809 RepID=UPI0020A0EE36|nr:autotransporter domain-containing protein [Sebaldella sp. S0638]MCP1222769.1 autotransporter domain-containing protein [Sebaldella sp. S0638]